MSLPQSAQDQEIRTSLKTLIRGLTQGNRREGYEGYKALYKIGASAIPQIREAIFQSNWAKVKRPNEIRYVSGLVSLLRDINEVEAEGVARQLIENGCDISVKRLVTSICSFTLTDYLIYDIRGIKVYEHKELFKHDVRSKLEKWLNNVPDKDLKEIERLYVITNDGRDKAGSYMPILFTIVVVWDNPFSRRDPFSWLLLQNIEYTLYHEIGHHIHRHSFGQIPEQEQEADAYARRLLKISHPVLGKIGYGIKKILLLLGLKKLRLEMRLCEASNSRTATSTWRAIFIFRTASRRASNTQPSSVFIRAVA